VDINQEINKHLGWIESVVSLVSGENITNNDIEDVSRGDLCDLGQWLNSADLGNVKSPAEFHGLKESHEAFHNLAGKLLAALSTENEDEVAMYLEKFIETSQQVIVYLYALQDKSESIP
jgi:hypothetical protein